MASLYRKFISGTLLGLSLPFRTFLIGRKVFIGAGELVKSIRVIG